MKGAKRDETDIERFYERDRELREDLGMSGAAIARHIGYTSSQGYYNVKARKSLPTKRRIHLMDQLYNAVAPRLKRAMANGGAREYSDEMGRAEKGVATSSTTREATSLPDLNRQLQTARWVMTQLSELLDDMERTTGTATGTR